MKPALLICALLACSSKTDERGTAVKPQPPPRDVAIATLSVAEVEAALWSAGPRATFRRTTSKEHGAIAKLVPALLEGSWAATPPDPSQWQPDAHAAGFRIEAWTVEGERYWALLEASGSARGAGAYIFRVRARGDAAPDRAAEILLQAPHSYHDVGTGRIAAQLFFAKRDGARPRALFANTIHRYQAAPGDKKKRKNHPSDVAHNADHAFTVATEAFAIAAGHARVIQLHGFKARENDDDGDPGSIAMVISAGDARGSSPLTAAIAAAATRAFGPDVRRFPEDTKILGATTNAQGRVLREHGRGDFVHVEMAPAIRDTLAASADARAQLAAVLFDTTPDTETRR